MENMDWLETTCLEIFTEKNSKEIIKVALNMVIKLVYDNDEKMLNYFESDIENMTVRIRNAVETGGAEKNFCAVVLNLENQY